MNNKVVLAKATRHAAEQLGLTTYQLEQVLGQNYTTTIELDPTSKSAQKALLLIHIFQSLYNLVGGDAEEMQHFMSSSNRITGGIPIKQIQEDSGLVRVLECLQALLTKSF